MNGVVDVDFTVRGCSSCHGGTLSGTDAAGVDLAPAPGSGAHVRHLTGGMARLRCSDCHGAVPTSMTHADGTVQLPFGGIAAGTQWNGSTCSTSYCHGAIGSGGANGGSGAVVSWEAMGEPLGCTACHHGGHYESHLGGACSSCHNHVNASGTAIIQPTLHVNGRRNMANCNSGCHNF